MNLHAIDFRHLRYFACVVEQGSFRAAAQRLHISQPPLTRQIQQIEEALGATLLIRKSRGVDVTAAGRVFYAEARNMLLLMEQAARRTKLVGDGQIGRLDIAVFGSAVFGAIPRIVRAFREQFPDVEVALHTMDRADQLKALRERRLTLGFNRFFEDEPELKWEAIQTERMNVAIHRSHRLAQRKILELADIASESLILYPRTPRPSFIEHMVKLFQRRKLVPRNIQEVDDVSTAVALVSSGFGLSLVTDSACNLRLPDVAYIPLAKEDRAVFDLCMIYREDDASALLKEFLRIARGLRSSLSSPGLSTDAATHTAAGRKTKSRHPAKKIT